jgi:hypothetical protein
VDNANSSDDCQNVLRIKYSIQTAWSSERPRGFFAGLLLSELTSELFSEIIDDADVPSAAEIAATNARFLVSGFPRKDSLKTRDNRRGFIAAIHQRCANNALQG